MKFRFTIGRKIGLGFGVIIFFMVVVFAFTITTVISGLEIFRESNDLNERITTIETPSLNVLIELKNSVQESKALITKWASEQSREDNPDKQKLIKLTEQDIPYLKTELSRYTSHWPEDEVRLITNTFFEIDTLFGLHDSVKTNLVNFESYEDPEKAFFARFMVETDGEIDKKSNDVIFLLDVLKKKQETRREKSLKSQNESREKTRKSFTFLLYLVIFSGVTLVAGSLLIATFTTRSIVRPIHNLKKMLLDLGRGIIPKDSMEPSDDEVGEMALALNTLVAGFQRTTEFSRQVGIGNFNYHYEPLSNDDVLGHALLKMRDDLAENERILEQKVIERTEEVVRQKEEIEKQRQKLEELYKDVTDSIRYAKRLQDSILPPDILVKNMLPDSFVLFKPKDIVSGDFYWFFQKGNKILFAAVDCTGHGVPGAFMSLVGSNALNQAVKEHGIYEPARILDDLNKLSSEALNKNVENNAIRDGMDLALCSLDLDTYELQFAGANNPLYIIRNDDFMLIKPDKFAIGAYDPGTKKYTNHKIQLEKGDVIYVFSDGYADQFGGTRGKKFMYRQFRDTLMEIRTLTMDQQKNLLNNTIEKWRGTFEQVDDILVIGIKI
jgi:serine phosphatase RsbU (regulator of sigma subunit)